METADYLSRKTRVSDQFAEALDSLGVNEDSVVVDIGCGAGRTSHYLYPTGARIFGLDLDTSIFDVPMACKVKGDANSDETWAQIPFHNVLVSCDAINKRGVRLETLLRRIQPEDKIAFKIQLADDLGGFVGPAQLYTIEEIRKLLPMAEITPLQFTQKFSSSDYLTTFLSRVGLDGDVPRFTKPRNFVRSYAIVTYGGSNG